MNINKEFEIAEDLITEFSNNFKTLKSLVGNEECPSLKCDILDVLSSFTRNIDRVRMLVDDIQNRNQYVKKTLL